MEQGNSPKEEVLAEEAESAEAAWRIATEAAVMVLKGLGFRGLSPEAASSAHTLLKTILDAGPAWALRAVLQAAGVESTASKEECMIPLTVGNMYMNH
jgi:hypothetical protein